MAISPILEQKDSRLIVKLLLNTNKTVKELNDYFMNQKEIVISTATLYRRVKELFFAGYLDKLDDGSYITSDHGKMTYNELFSRNNQLAKDNNNNSDMVRQLTGKESYVLRRLQIRPAYTSGLIKDITISPNDLLQILDSLIQLQLIEVIEKSGKKPGRPKKIYRLTENGKLILKQIDKLKKKLQR